MHKMQEAFQAVEGERQYQNQKWDPNDPDVSGQHTALEWLVYIEDYSAEAKRVLSRYPEKEAREFALHQLRKIAAMAVAAMEQNGVRTRTEEGGRPVGYVRT